MTDASITPSASSTPGASGTPSASGPSVAAVTSGGACRAGDPLTLWVLDSSYGDILVEQAAAGPVGVTVHDARDARQDRPLPPANGVLVQHATIGGPELDRNPLWRVVGRYGVGFDTIDVDAATERGVAVVNVPDYCDEEVATHAAALVLASTRKVDQSAAMVRQGRWAEWGELRPIRPLSTSTLGLLGLGRIGRAVVDRLRPFFGDIVAHDPVAATVDGVDLVDLDDLFSQADVLSLHCPLVPETRHIVDGLRLGRMKPGSFLVNVSRGGLVDGAALAGALTSGHLAGAALDVLETEPPSADEPLLAAPNLLVTNHLAWYSAASEPRLRSYLAERCAAVLVGADGRSVVNAAALGWSR